MANVFISYSRRDRDRVVALAAALEGEGLSVWWDPNLVPGRRFREMISEQLAAADCVVVVWTAASLESDWVQDEADEGRQRGVLIPVKLEPVKAPAGFRQVQAADLSQWTGAPQHPEFRALVLAAKSLAEMARRQRPAPMVEPGAVAAEPKPDVEPELPSLPPAQAAAVVLPVQPPAAVAPISTAPAAAEQPPVRTEPVATAGVSGPIGLLALWFDDFSYPLVWVGLSIALALMGQYHGVVAELLAITPALAGSLAFACRRAGVSSRWKAATLIVSVVVLLTMWLGVFILRGGVYISETYHIVLVVILLSTAFVGLRALRIWEVAKVAILLFAVGASMALLVWVFRIFSYEAPEFSGLLLLVSVAVAGNYCRKIGFRSWRSASLGTVCIVATLGLVYFEPLYVEWPLNFLSALYVGFGSFFTVALLALIVRLSARAAKPTPSLR